jgi:myo-inositol-1-phosphate synthase
VTPKPNSTPRRLGIWLVGARGSISTCVAYGLAGLREGLLEPVGIATEHEPFRQLDLAGLDDIALGGHDVCTRDLSLSATELVRHGILSSDLVAASAVHVGEFERRIRAGTLDGPDVGVADLDPRAARLGAAAPREQIDEIAADIADFKRELDLTRVVVVNVASTEAFRHELPEWSDLAALERALDAGRAQPASLLYAYAAISGGSPYVNFTPNRSASSPALRELARERGVPHCGSDGKTGETLVKTVLAPMFTARALRVLAWQGYNMLGNRDGEVLADISHRETKLRNKNDALRSILNDDGAHTHVGIDFVPSLQDWKTAWDFIHFEGFLGAKMSLQFTWTGSDSCLAAPLVIDLARWADFAAEKKEAGEMAHTASYFKAPIAGGTHDFHAQYAVLLEYAARHLEAARPRAAVRRRGAGERS